MAERAHLSIGEVLSLLREEFPDITISKIRFLESQGLLDPERTPSGYRKFYEEDVDRLRWILRQQRENFLPLKVIKGRLSDHSEPLPGAPADIGIEPAAAPTPAATAPVVGLGAQAGNATFTRQELALATGLTEQAIAELEGFGLIASRDVGGSAYFDDEGATIAALAAGFARHGVEARHLRMYKNAAERESGLFEQVVMPMIKQRNPQARQQAIATLDELASLSIELRRALLRQALGNTF
ncbi:MAG: MerR family transcriptional regulator [Actinomycetota bacterium]|nr:MerR family transcriptional regulator [Actinomycetota bacterium]